MMSKLLLLLPLLFLTGCVSTYQITVAPTENQETLYRDGINTVFSAKKHLVAFSVSKPIIQGNQRYSLAISVQNLGEVPFDFSTANIIAYNLDKTSKLYSQVKVFSYAELAEEERKRQASAALGAVLQGLGASLQASNAGYQTTSGTYSGSTYGSGNYNGPYTYNSSTSGVYSSTTYNAAAAQQAQIAAQNQTQQNIDRLKIRAKENMSRLNTVMLKRHTVLPGEWHGGYIQVALPEEIPVESQVFIGVEFDGEDHVFSVTSRKIEK